MYPELLTLSILLVIISVAPLLDPTLSELNNDGLVMLLLLLVSLHVPLLLMMMAYPLWFWPIHAKNNRKF